MGGWYISRRGPDTDKTLAQTEAARAQFARQGFTQFIALSTKTHTGFACPHILGGPAHFVSQGNDWIAVAGTIFYEGTNTDAALLKMLGNFSFPFSNWEKIDGQFAAIIAKDNNIYIFNDFFGNFQIFHDPLVDSVTTSFLSLATQRQTLTPNTQGIYEFVFNTFPTGDDTVFNEIIRLGASRQFVLNDISHAEIVSKPLSEPRPWSDDRIDPILDRMRQNIDRGVSAWNGNVQAPLTGGLDSRLILALLRDRGVKPHLYVYGSDGDDDVEVAKSITNGEGYDLEIFNKTTWRHIEPDAFASQVEQNFHEIDALATDESLFDNGANAFARKQRQSDGALAVSGGCGEIFRNFFFLPDRPMRALNIVRAFYSGYDKAELTDRFSPHRYEMNLAHKLERTLEAKSELLSRRRIEELYPRFRCRAFFGRELSIVGTLGGYLMPFLDYGLVNQTLDIPFKKRRAGALQSELIAKIDPRLAAYSSNYGHSFDRAPGLGHVLAESSTVYRPNQLRKSSYAIRNRLDRKAEPMGLLSDAYLGQVIDLGFPFMRRYFKVDCIKNQRFYSRVASIEYLAAFLGSRLKLD